jgi:3-hydroxybutyryl-CoA dehydratase
MQQRTARTVGDALPAVRHLITQEQLLRYAHTSGDHNPLHLDPDFAAKTQFGGTIAHGMLILAFASEMMTEAFGREWVESGRLKIRFRAPARPGDEVTSSGTVIKLDGSHVTCEIECRNSRGEVLLSGEAGVNLE